MIPLEVWRMDCRGGEAHWKAAVRSTDDFGSEYNGVCENGEVNAIL